MAAVLDESGTAITTGRLPSPLGTSGTGASCASCLPILRRTLSTVAPKILESGREK